jgi:hypothetical protein
MKSFNATITAQKMHQEIWLFSKDIVTARLFSHCFFWDC